MSLTDLNATNWRTTAAGALCILMAMASAFGVTIPGMGAENPGTLLTVGFGLLFAKDAAAKK